MKNPFQILWLHPDILKDIPDTQIIKLLTSQRNTLMKIFHSDVVDKASISWKKAEKKVKEINEAFEYLTSDSTDIKQLKEEYSKPKASKILIEEKQKQVNILLSQKKNLLNSFSEYLKWLWNNINVLGNVKPCKIRVQDYIKSLHSSREQEIDKRIMDRNDSQHLSRKEKTDKMRNEWFFEIEINHNQIKKISYDWNVEDISKKNIIWFISSSSLLPYSSFQIYLQNCFKEVMKEEFILIWDETIERINSENQVLKNLFPIEFLWPLLDWFTSLPQNDSYIISTSTIQWISFFSIEGKIRTITEL